MKSLYCIAGSLPAQFRSSQVDCGIGWKEHAKQEPRKAKTDNIALEMKEQLETIVKFNAELEALTQASVAVCKNYQPPLDKHSVLFGIDPAAETKPPIDFSTIKPGDKVMLVDGKTFDSFWGKNLTVNGIYTVCEADHHEYQGVRVYDEKGRKIWVYNTDVRPIGFDLAKPSTSAPNSDKAKVSLGDVAVSVKTGSSCVRLDGPSYWNEE